MSTTKQRRGQTTSNNLLAQAMTQNRNVRQNEASVSSHDLARIRQNIQSIKNEAPPKTTTDLILEVNRVPQDYRSSDMIHSRISEYFYRNGQSSLNKW